MLLKKLLKFLGLPNFIKVICKYMKRKSWF